MGRDNRVPLRGARKAGVDLDRAAARQPDKLVLPHNCTHGDFSDGN